MQTQTPWPQPSLDMDWTMQQYPGYQFFLANETQTPSRVYKRRASSRVSKPSSAGNSPHSLPRRRTMTNQSWKPETTTTTTHPVTTTIKNNNNARKSRPTSWHPSSRAAASAFHPYAQQQHNNCHPSWLNSAAAANMGLLQQDSALSTPITCPVSGDLISNDSFAMLDNYYGASTTMGPAQPQTYGPVDMYSGWSTNNNNITFPDQAWTHHASGGGGGGGGYFPTADQMADFCCHESVVSSDPSTAPATPDATTLSHPVYNNNNDEQFLPSQAAAAAGRGDDLVALGLYDEPQVLSLGSSLLEGSFDSLPPAGKGLKLEETFSPAPVAEEDDDAEHEDD